MFRRRVLGLTFASALLATLAALTLAAPSASAQEPGAAAPARAGGHAKELFRRYCASCHGLGGKGDGRIADQLKTPPSDLTTISQRRNNFFPEQEISEIIDGRKLDGVHGERTMPVWGEQLGLALPSGSASEKEAAVRARINLLTLYLKKLQVSG